MKKLVAIIVVIIIVSVGAFYGGMRFTQSKSASGFSKSNFQNFSPEERQQKFQELGFKGGGQKAGAGMASGEIIAKDEKSITIKLRDGGSKIVFYSSATKISKFANAALADLETGKEIIVNGKANSDGSIIAESIQLRPPQPVTP